MERRYYSRMAANVKAVIFQGGLPVAIARVRDASKFGFFVETEFTDVALYQTLDIELPLRVDHCLRHFRFPAQVSRKSDQGLALSIGQDNEEARRALFLLVENYALVKTALPPKVANA